MTVRLDNNYLRFTTVKLKWKLAVQIWYFLEVDLVKVKKKPLCSNGGLVECPMLKFEAGEILNFSPI